MSSTVCAPLMAGRGSFAAAGGLLPLQQKRQSRLGRPLPPSRAAVSRPLTTCVLEPQDQSAKASVPWQSFLKSTAVFLAASALVLGAPSGDALAAQTSGRVGGRQFRSAAPPPQSSRTIIRNNTTIVSPPSVYAPPIFSPFGYSPFGGFGYGPTVVVGGAGIGSIFTLMFEVMLGLFLFQFVLGIISSVMGRKDRDDERY